MSSMLLNVVVGLALSALIQGPQVQKTQTISITEPGIIKIADLFKMSDAVVLARIVSGDTESYEAAVYKAEVLQSLKGATNGAIIYYGPYVGSRLGNEYLLFLLKGKKPAVPSNASKTNFGTVTPYLVFNEGYSSMETSYECVFAGKEVAEQCDYAVRVCTDYIITPKSLPTFPPLSEDTPFGCRWVKRDSFLAILAKFRDANN